MVLTKKDSVLNEIFQLSPIDRVEIAEKILTSFENPLTNEIDETWALESENRIDEYISGKSKTSSMDDVFKNINHKNK